MFFFTPFFFFQKSTLHSSGEWILNYLKHQNKEKELSNRILIHVTLLIYKYLLQSPLNIFLVTCKITSQNSLLSETSTGHQAAHYSASGRHCTQDTSHFTTAASSTALHHSCFCSVDLFRALHTVEFNSFNCTDHDNCIMSEKHLSSSLGPGVPVSQERVFQSSVRPKFSKEGQGRAGFPHLWTFDLCFLAQQNS